VRLDQAARLILRDPELARDAVQEALIRAWRDLAKLRDPDRFDAWLHRLTVNSCLDQTRRRRRRVAEVELTPIHAPFTSDTTRAHADRDEVDRVLRQLDERGRAIVVLHYYVGMPLTEVAATLTIPIGTVKSRLHRALTEMRVAIDAEPAAVPAPVSGGQPA
jgi:RNA polymerase sigma-70 factor (ECF subfamily)